MCEGGRGGADGGGGGVCVCGGVCVTLHQYISESADAAQSQAGWLTGAGTGLSAIKGELEKHCSRMKTGSLLF